MRRICAFVVSLASLLLLSLSCALAEKAAGPLNVVTTTGMIADLVQSIGKDRVKVVALMGPGIDPHLYKATHGDLQRLTGADAIFFNGLHLEGKMADVLEKFSEKKPCFAVTSEIPEDKLRRPPEFEGQFDPHVWFDVSLWAEAARKVEKELALLLPNHAQEIHQNAAAYYEELKALDEFARTQVATIPEQSRVLVTAHDAFGYFGRAYNIDVMGLQGISTATEYGLHDLTRLISVIIERKVKAVFVETSVPKKFVAALQEGVAARGFKVSIGGELYSDAMGEAGTPEGTYLGMVRHNVNTIVSALK